MVVQTNLSWNRSRAAETLDGSPKDSRGVDFVQVETVEEAERLCERPLPSMGVIIINLYDRRGLEAEVCRLLRGVYECPILVLTSERDEDHQVRVYKAGADECIVRPISEKLLMAKANRWMIQAQLSMDGSY